MNSLDTQNPVAPARGSAASPTRLSKSAARLLTALAGDRCAALRDPTREATLILRSSAGAVSLGQGAHPEAAAEELAGQDLVVREPPAGPLRSVTISEPGRARLRREDARDEPFARQHRDTVTEPAGEGGARVVVNASESPLDWLRRRKDRDGVPLIDPACFEAGERLRRDLTLGGMLPSVTARWEGGIGGGAHDPAAATDAMIAARQRARAALAEIGADFADLLIDLCGFLKGLETVERERGWPPRSGKVVVRMALRRLAQHYGLETEARGPERSRGLRTWRSAEERAASPG